MILRPCRPEDFPALWKIDQACFPPGIAYQLQDLLHWMRQPGAFAIVAEDERSGRIAGFTLARTVRHRQGHIVTIDVLPEYRRMGVATTLMELAHTRLKESGATTVELETSVENAAGIAFYHKLGYQTADRLRRYYLNRLDAWRMTKEL